MRRISGLTADLLVSEEAFSFVDLVIQLVRYLTQTTEIVLALETLGVLIITRKILVYAYCFGSICFAQYLNRKSGIMTYS